MLSGRNVLLCLLFVVLLGLFRAMGAVRMRFYARKRPLPTDIAELARANRLTTMVLLVALFVTCLFAVVVAIAAI